MANAAPSAAAPAAHAPKKPAAPSQARFALSVSRKTPGDPSDDCVRKLRLIPIPKEKEKDNLHLEKVTWHDSAKVDEDTEGDLYLQIWEMDFFNEHHSEAGETDPRERKNVLLAAIPGVVAKEGSKFIFRPTDDPVGESGLTEATRGTYLENGRLRLELTAVDSDEAATMEVGFQREHEAIVEIAFTLRSRLEDRTYETYAHAAVEQIHNVRHSLRRQLLHQNGIAVSFVADYTRSTAPGDVEFARQAEEMLETIPTFVVKDGGVKMGYHLMPKYQDVGPCLADLRAAAKAAVNFFRLPKVSNLVFYGHGIAKKMKIELDPSSPEDFSKPGSLNTRNARDFVSSIREHVSDDVVITIFACSTGRSLSAGGDRFSDVAYGMHLPCEEVGAESLAWMIFRELKKQGIRNPTVWAHTTGGHTTRNPVVRVFSSPGSADLVNLLFKAPVVSPQTRRSYLSKFQASDKAPKEEKIRKERNGNLIRTLAVQPASHFDWNWLHSKRLYAPPRPQVRDDSLLIAARDAVLALITEGAGPAIPADLLFESPANAYITGLRTGLEDARLTQDFHYRQFAPHCNPFRLNVRLVGCLQILKDRSPAAFEPTALSDHGATVEITPVTGTPPRKRQKLLEEAANMAAEGLVVSAVDLGDAMRLSLVLPAPDPGIPSENFPYRAETFEKIGAMRAEILKYSRIFNVPPVAVFGSIADEFNTRQGYRTAVDIIQDGLIGFMPNILIELAKDADSQSKFLNPVKNDLGKGNINLETARKIYDLHRDTFEKINWQYSDLVAYLESDAGTAHVAALFIAQGLDLLWEEISDYELAVQEAVLVTFFKQGEEKYVGRFLEKKKTDPDHRIIPGEGWRVFLQRDKIVAALGIPP
jgi:hypothetical protein